jgi:tetratricopeptide (TPR) repeat protein
LLARSRLHNDNRIMNLPGAIADTTEIIRLDPKNAVASRLRASARSRAGDHRRAIEDATEAIRLDPNQINAYAYRGGAYAALGESKHAIVDLNELLSRLPKSPLCQFDPAIADLTETIRRNRKMAETKDVSGYSARAHAYLVRGDTDRAIADCESARKIDRKALWVIGYRGFANARKGQWDRALADFDEEASRRPDTKRTSLTSKANLLAVAGGYELAAATYDDARKADAGFLRAILSCRASYLDRSRGDYDEAIKNLNLAEHPVWPPQVFLYRGIIYAQLGQPDRALADFKKLTDIMEESRRDFFAIDDFV